MKKNFKLAVASGKGGVGKSMLASSLAILFAKTKERVVALDCDVDAPNLAIWLNEIGRCDKIEKISTLSKPIIDYKRCDGCGKCVKNCQFGALEMVRGKPRMNPFICEGCGVCEILCPQKAITLKAVENGVIKIKNTKYGFPLISGQLFPGETGSGKIVSRVKWAAEQLMDESSFARAREGRVMIIDSSPGTGCPVIASLQDSDYVILVTEPTPSAFSDLKKVLGVVGHFSLSYGVVINKWDINQELTNRISRWAGKRILGRISYDQNIFKAVANLRPIMETDLRAREEIKNIFSNLK